MSTQYDASGKLKTIVVNGQCIEILNADETAEVRCVAGDYYIKPDENRLFWVYAWDGREAFSMGEQGFESLGDAIDFCENMATCDFSLEEDGF